MTKAEPDMKKDLKPQLKIEKGLEILDDLVKRLESGSQDLDDSFVIFEKAVKIAKRLQKKLEEYERKIEIITDASEKEVKLNKFDEYTEKE